MRAYDSYHDAHEAAISLARASGLDVGLAKGNEYGRTVFTLRYLPKPENRCGHELRCEIVRPTDPKGVTR